MRTLSLVAGVIAVGTLAALPFRRTEALIEPKEPASIATGPLGHQVEDDAMNGVLQWPDRPGFDPSLAWQPRPMTMDLAPRSYEMPKMPDAFPGDSVQVPVPAPIRERFAAAMPIPAPVEDPTGVGANGLLMPQVAHIEDRFVYTPPPEPTKSLRRPSFQSASVISHDESSPHGDASSTPATQYIREPQ